MSFDGNEKLKPANVIMSLTVEEVLEKMKCEDDPIYFISNYIKVVAPGKGLVKFTPYPYQVRMARAIVEKRFVIGLLPRQCGKSTIVSAIIAWMLLFSQTDAINILIAANKSSSAVEIMRKVKIAIENVPSFLQQGIKKWNEFGIELENGNRCTATATSGDTGRSGSYDLIMLDEFAFVKPNIAEEFYTSSYPTISSNPKSKVVVVSTPNGMNLFHNMWTMAQEKKNEYYPIEIKWNDVPGRDERFKQETISNLGHNGVARWAQEYECEFAGGASSLIPSHAILAQPIMSPIEIIPPDNIKVFKKVNEGDSYMICVDTGRGRGIDFSAFTVINISRMPYEVVATYKNDNVDHMYYPDVIYAAAQIYNQAQVLIETNDLGESVAKILYEMLEYENVLFVETRGRSGQVLGPTGNHVGVTTSAKTKAIGCSALKALCEAGQIHVHDHDIIYEMSNFIRIGTTYKAQKGNHDDLIMTLVMFAWATTQQYFADLTNMDIKSILYDQKVKHAEEQMIPFGFRTDHGEVDYGLNDTLFTDDF